MQKIEFHYELDFLLHNEEKYRTWINDILISEEFKVGAINYIFCTDEYLLKIHKEHLAKDTFTDIITFDYSGIGQVSGDIFISIDRVIENAETFGSGFDVELLRVMSHGLLHMMGYNDKDQEDLQLMRLKEEEKIKMFHVEQ